MEQGAVNPGQSAGFNFIRVSRFVRDYCTVHALDAGTVFGPLDPDPIRSGEIMPLERWQAMLVRATEHLCDEALPIRMAAAVRPQNLGLLGFLLMSCETLGAAATTLGRYSQLLANGRDAYCQLDETHWHFTWRALIDQPRPELVQFSVALWVRLARSLVARKDLRCRVSFNFDAPRDDKALACYHELFGRDVHFNQARSEIICPREYLMLPLSQCDRGLHELLRAQAEEELAEISQPGSAFMRQLETLVEHRLESGPVSLDEVSQALALSRRGLQHRLDDHGITYRELLNRVRCRLAERHLRNPALSLVDVSLMLGFADQSSFQHAFKRWTGWAPGEYRRHLAQGAHDAPGKAYRAQATSPALLPRLGRAARRPHERVFND